MDHTDEPSAYVSEHLREQLLRTPDIGELDVHVTVDNKLVVVTGHVSTPERREAISRVVSELLPDHDVRNETTVTAYPEPPDEAVG
jgi:osmotically-inducible protein OsmY